MQIQKKDEIHVEMTIDITVDGFISLTIGCIIIRTKTIVRGYSHDYDRS